MTADELITKKDLELFKQELLALLANRPERPKWLKAAEVRKLLGISHGTLQSFRVNGDLPYSKVGGTYFYKAEEVDKMLERGEKKSPKRSKS